ILLKVLYLQQRERVADAASEGVFRLEREKLLTAVEDGLPLETVAEFLARRGARAIPETVSRFLADVAATAHNTASNTARAEGKSRQTTAAAAGIASSEGRRSEGCMPYPLSLSSSSTSTCSNSRLMW
ncbi:MAG: hypothetical protein AAB215_04425, partial [Planctomycetota bacterium]